MHTEAGMHRMAENEKKLMRKYWPVLPKMQGKRFLLICLQGNRSFGVFLFP
jgi:hypothetical protein